MASAALASQETLTPAEIERANLYLDQTRNGGIGAIKGLSETQWRYKPSPDIWSIAQNMQHVTFVQERVLAILHDQLPNAPLSPEGRDCELVDAIIIHRFPNRLAKFQAPEASQPK